ncbi:MAG: hypothetical protein ACXVEF_08140 [Polyangiales bacterium]
MRLLVAACVGLLGCNALTGANDLEEVPCTTDCLENDTGAFDSSAEDTSLETAIEDSGNPNDAALDADASADVFKPCTVNKDCDDKDDCTRDTCDLDGGTCSSAKVDEDGDGQSPSGLGACGMDCNDTNKDVFAMQTAWFSVPYLDAVGASSYDYDCNGVAEREKTAAYKCVLSSGSKCTLTEGWSGTIPACGATGTYVTACVYSPFGGTCTPSGAKTKQRCR